MDPQRFVLLLLVACAALNCVAGQCSLNYKTDFDTDKAPPVFMTNGKYLVPDATGTITIATGNDVVISCPGNNNIVNYAGPHANSVPKLSEWVGRCVAGKIFKAFQIQFNLFQTSCKNQPDVTIKNLQTRCGNQNIPNNNILKYRVGYTVRGDFHPLYEACFDNKLLTTYYVKHLVYPYSDLTTQKTTQSFLISGMFNRVPMNELYTKKYQITRFNSIFGTGQTYTTSRILEKGHLASRADFVMAAQVRATYQYINAGPQWNAVNAPRWFSLESALRKYMKGKTTHVVVYTGTHGVLSLPKTFSPDKEVHLYTDATHTNVVPVPMYFYKVVDEPGQPKVVYITINWDSTSNINVSSLRFCNDPCTLHWNNSGGTLSFCCSFNNFVAHIGYTPN